MSLSLATLTAQLDRVHSKENLLVVDPRLLSFIDQLASFSTLKAHGHFDHLLWLDEKLASHPGLNSYQSIIVITGDYFDTVDRLLPLLSHRLHVVIANMPMAMLGRINEAVRGRLGDVLDLPVQPVYSCTSRCKIYPWKVLPIGDKSKTIIGGSVADYIHNPLKQLDQLALAVVDIAMGNDKIPQFKFRNRFAKGTHAQALVKLVEEIRIPENLAKNLTATELEFYYEHKLANADLVVLDRSIDWAPAVMDQVSYLGLIDDIFGLEYDKITGNPHQVPEVGKPSFSDDNLYSALQDFNFSMVGGTLNKMARQVQAQQQQMRIDPEDIHQMKDVALLLGLLTQQQQTIKRHTIIAEQILEVMDTDFLEFESELFDLEYLDAVARLRLLLWKQVLWDRAIAAAALVLMVHDGIRPRDWDWLMTEFVDNYGTSKALVLHLALSHGLIVVKEDNDFLTTFTRGKETKSAEAVVAPLSQLGISGAESLAHSNYTLVDKFFALHPAENDPDEDKDTIGEHYPLPGFSLPGNTVPVLIRLVEALYLRDFFTYKPVVNSENRPTWEGCGVNQFWQGPVVDRGSEGPTEVTVVVVVGGVTRAEMAGFQWLREKLGREILVVSPSIVNRGRLLEGLGSE